MIRYIAINDHLIFQARLLSDDLGAHLMDVEDMLQKHSLLESDINIIGERVRNAVAQAQRCVLELSFHV